MFTQMKAFLTMCPQWQAVHGYTSVVSPRCSSYHPTQLLFAWLRHYHSCSGTPETCSWPPLLTQTLLSSPLRWYEPGSQRTVLEHLSSVFSARQEVRKHCFILLVYQTTSKLHGREGNERLSWIPSFYYLSPIHHGPKPPAHLDLSVQLLYLQLLPLHDLKGKVIKKARKATSTRLMCMRIFDYKTRVRIG